MLIDESNRESIESCALQAVSQDLRLENDGCRVYLTNIASPFKPVVSRRKNYSALIGANMRHLEVLSNYQKSVAHSP